MLDMLISNVGLSGLFVTLVIASTLFVIYLKCTATSTTVLHGSGGKTRLKTKNKTTDDISILKFLERSKPFPITPASGWKLKCFSHDQRVWELRSKAVSDQRHLVFGCFRKVKVSPQVVLNTLKDVSKYEEWRSDIQSVSVHRAEEAIIADNHKHNTKKSASVQHDVITAELPTSTYSIYNIVYSTLQKITKMFLSENVHIFHRYWNRQENGCTWLLEVNQSEQRWLFYLAQPMAEVHRCVLTVLGGCTRHAQRPEAWVASTSGSLRNYFIHRRVLCTPLTILSVPVDGSLDSTFNQQTIANCVRLRKLIEDFAKQNEKEKYAVDDEDSNLWQKFQNFVTQMKTELNKVKYNLKVSDNDKNGILSTNSDGCNSSQSPGNTYGEFDSDSDNVFVSASKLDEKCFLKLLRGAKSRLSSNEDISLKTQTTTALEDLHQVDLGRISPSLDIDDVRTDECESSWSDDSGQRSTESDVIHFGEAELLEARYRTLANQVAADLMVEMALIAKIEISRPAEKQIELTKGWTYYGLEQDVAILRKVHGDNSGIYSFLGKGLIPSSPVTVFEALKNPRTRFTYDETLKKLDILHDFGHGLKVVYMYHEMTQLFTTKESRDFCLMQNERIEGENYMISLRSVDWDSCPSKKDIIRGKFLSSGWIIAPARRKNKSYSMVTYIVQFDFGEVKPGSTVLEEMAASQPMSIPLLRDYLVPANAISRSISCGQLGHKPGSSRSPHRKKLASSLSATSVSSITDIMET